MIELMKRRKLVDCAAETITEFDDLVGVGFGHNGVDHLFPQLTLDLQVTARHHRVGDAPKGSVLTHLGTRQCKNDHMHTNVFAVTMSYGQD